jgi:hypothetical protein
MGSQRVHLVRLPATTFVLRRQEARGKLRTPLGNRPHNTVPSVDDQVSRIGTEQVRRRLRRQRELVEPSPRLQTGGSRGGGENLLQRRGEAVGTGERPADALSGP